LCLTTIFDFYTLQGHGTPLGFSLDPKCAKTICCIAFLPANVSKISVCSTLTSKTFIESYFFEFFAEQLALLMRILVVKKNTLLRAIPTLPRKVNL